jgi:hypothetical protein
MRSSVLFPSPSCLLPFVATRLVPSLLSRANLERSRTLISGMVSWLDDAIVWWVHTSQCMRANGHSTRAESDHCWWVKDPKSYLPAVAPVASVCPEKVEYESEELVGAMAVMSKTHDLTGLKPRSLKKARSLSSKRSTAVYTSPHAMSRRANTHTRTHTHTHTLFYLFPLVFV